MTEIELTESTLIIHMKGFTKFNATLNRVQLKIPLAHVVGAEIGATVTEKLGSVGLIKLFSGFGTHGAFLRKNTDGHWRNMEWQGVLLWKDKIYSMMGVNRGMPLRSNSLMSAMRC